MNQLMWSVLVLELTPWVLSLCIFILMVFGIRLLVSIIKD